MDKEALFFQLEAYLKGELPEAERAALQKQIETGEEAAEQLAMLRLEKELGNLLAEDELEAKMQQWSVEKEARRKTEGNGKPGPKGWWRTGRLPLLFLLSLLIAIGYQRGREAESPEVPAQDPSPSIQTPTNLDIDAIQDVQEPESQGEEVPPAPPSPPPVAKKETLKEDPVQLLALATAEATSPIGNMNIRSTGAANPNESLLAKGYRLMGEGRLEEAQEVLESVTEESPGLYRNAQLYLAYVHFEQKNYTAAIPVLENLVSIGYADLEKMKWYLALAYLATGNKAKGMPLVREVASDSPDATLRQAATAFSEQLN